jgi:hypothetical protein
MARLPLTVNLSAARGSPSRLTQAVAFLVGFGIQFNVLIGGGGEGVTAIGGFGFRLTDFMSAGAIALLCIFALRPNRIMAVGIFALGVGILALLRILDPLFWVDPRTDILCLHYLGYSFAGLYFAMILRTRATIDRFCWGLIVGMLLTVPIFVLQALGYASTLVNFGLVPEYYTLFFYENNNLVRYSGLWGHPNEASHVAALSAAAGAYFTFVYRRYLPLALTAAGLLAIFYFTQSRGGLLVSGAVLAVPLLFGTRHQFNILHVLLGIFVIGIVSLLVSQLDVIALRFTDAEAGHNFSERIASTVAALQLLLSNPLGMPDSYFQLSLVHAVGVGSPHNGFIFFAAIFGLAPLTVLIVVFAVNLRRWHNDDAFFALFTFQICLSFLFEQMALSYCYALAICLLLGRAYLKTRLGAELVTQTRSAVSRMTAQRYLRRHAVDNSLASGE